MAAPVRSDFKLYLGANGVPVNNTDPIGGAIDTLAEVDENDVGNLYGSLRVAATDTVYYTVAYYRAEHTAPGTAANARVSNRAGARVNTSAASANVVSTNANDTGTIRVVGKISGAWDYEDLVLEGLTPVIGSKVWDVGTVVRWEAVSGTTLGNVTCAVNSYICGVIWGTNDDPADGGPSIATRMASAEIQLALATAKNAAISSTNRLTAPASGISAFSTATKWEANDQSINVPSGSMSADDYIGVAVMFTAYGSVPAPTTGKMQFRVQLTFDSEGT